MFRKAIIILLTLLSIAVLIDSLIVYQGDSKSGRRFHTVPIGADRSLWFRARGNEVAAMYFTLGDEAGKDFSLASPLGFGLRRAKMFDRSSNKFSQTAFAVFCPTWFVVLVLNLYPLIALLNSVARRRRRRRRRRGLCVKCGYNLTGNTSGVCPECGNPTHEVGRSEA